MSVRLFVRRPIGYLTAALDRLGCSFLGNMHEILQTRLLISIDKVNQLK